MWWSKRRKPTKAIREQEARDDEGQVFGWLCCFCGGEIIVEGADPCTLSLKIANGRDQWWACHSGCFKERLNPDPMFEPGIF